MPIYRAKRGVINTKCCVKFNFLNTEGGEKKDELIDGLTSAAYCPTSPRKEFVTREKFEANYKKVSRKAKVSSERTFHRAGITREERKPVNNDFSGGVDVPEKRTAYAFTNFFEDTEDTPPSSAQEYTRDCRYSTRINRYYSARLHSVDQPFYGK